MTQAPILEAERLAVGYRRHRRRRAVLSALNLSVTSGELICVLGPNGIGKSTMLRTLSGLQRPLAGTLSVFGQDLARMTAARRARLIGVVLSERIWVGALRARQMVALGRYAHSSWNGRLSERDDEIIDRAIKAVGAAHLAERDCRELSDGERQKLNLARVLAQEPAIIVLDEPTAFLDVAARVTLMTLLRRLTRETGIAVIASMHDLDLAIRNADSVWLIGADQLLQCGAPEDLVARGVLEQAFSSGDVRFDTSSFSFHDIDSNLPTAFVTGSAQGVRLAAIALRRHRFRLVADRSDASVVIDSIDDAGRWRASHNGSDLSGTNFAALATFARNAFITTGRNATASEAEANHRQSEGN